MTAAQTSKTARFAKAAIGTLGALTIATGACFAQVPEVARAEASLALAIPATATAVMPSELEAQVIDLVNNDRAAYGLAPVEFDPALLATARERAAAQSGEPFLNHYDDDGKLAFVKNLARDGVGYELAGENLARMTDPDDSTALRAEDALMLSPTHRANILEPTFNHIAVGATMDAEGRVVLAQIFGSY